jgi:hypothetical protein
MRGLRSVGDIATVPASDGWCAQDERCFCEFHNRAGHSPPRCLLDTSVTVEGEVDGGPAEASASHQVMVGFATPLASAHLR